MDVDLVLDEVRQDVFDQPKPTIDLDYLYSVKKEIQIYAEDTNSQLKKNVYQNYSLFIDSSREISTLKEEMRQLNALLEQQQDSMNKLLDQINKSSIIQSNIERSGPRSDIFSNLDNFESNDDDQDEILPVWFVKSPEDFDVLIAQRNLKEAVALAKKVTEHFLQYPKCCDNKQSDLKNKIENRVKELINVICSELQPATDRSVQGGPRSSISSIQLLRELNLSSRAVKLYLDLRSSVLHFVLNQQKIDSTTRLQFIKQICSIFLHNVIETCTEFKQAFEVDRFINKTVDECDYLLDTQSNRPAGNQSTLFNLIRPIYTSKHPKSDRKLTSSNGNDISSQILSPHAVKVADDNFMSSNGSRKIFNQLSTYASLIYWITLEFEDFLAIFQKHVFSNNQMSISMIAESVYFLKNQSSRITAYCDIDLSQFTERELRDNLKLVIDESGRKLSETIKKLDTNETWQPQQFQNKAEKTRFLEEMNDVDLKTMPKYITDDLKLHFTTSKTAFARFFLVSVSDLAKLVTPINKDHVDTVLAAAFELQMESVIEALGKSRASSRARFIKGNSNFLLDKVILVAGDRYTTITNLRCQKLADLRAKYQAQADSVAKLQNV